MKILSFLNPAKIFRGIRYRNKQRSYDRSAFDLELYLYSRILKNDMLHYGYFSNVNIRAEDISISTMEQAQMHYAERILTALHGQTTGLTLDAGSGMGGLTGLLLHKGIPTEALTPNDHQAEYVTNKYKDLSVHHCKYETFDSQQTFQAIIHSESLQYIPLDAAFEKSAALLARDGQWIITDYFRMNTSGVNTSGHLLQEFRSAVARHGWEIREEVDLTANILPTLKLLQLYADRFALPLKHFIMEKFRYKRPFFYFMTELRASVDEKLNNELAAIDPMKFVSEKKYMLFVLEKRST